MDGITRKFIKLGVDNAPGQESRQKEEALPIRGEVLKGRMTDFSHGDVDAFTPIPGAMDEYVSGVKAGASQAYTEYRGKNSIRAELAEKLAEFTASPINGDSELILTPGTQGALFLALGATVANGDKVAIVEPDYFANRKLVEFFEGIIVPIPLNYSKVSDRAGLDLDALEKAFQEGVKVFEFSNPNNPTGVIYSTDEIRVIAELAEKYGVTVIVDELYSRQIFDNRPYTHMRGQGILNPERLITIIGPSKTESLSGYRLGAAFGASEIIARMEKLQAIVCLRCAGYNQSVFRTWFSEPEGWMDARVQAHQDIRDDLIDLLREVEGVEVRVPEGGSYLFPCITNLEIDIREFVKILRKLADVIVTPGTEFGPQFINCFRINFSQDSKAAHDAIKRTIEVIKRYQK